MSNQIFTFSFIPDWHQLIEEISQIDRFDASWKAIEKREGQTLKHLKNIATVQSVAASTRIEGSKMTDAEVEAFVQNIDISKLEDRDHQEVAGYFRVLDIIGESYSDIGVSEGDIKNLHKMMLAHSLKDEWHRGDYKQQSNTVQATYPDGATREVFKTTAPGMATELAMQKLIDWWHTDKKTHTLTKISLFVYEFLSIHPFQDGNGRLSRLLGTLLLLKHGYSWIEYVSFEHEIERRKKEYYRQLMECQSQRPGEEVYPWVSFFLDCLQIIQQKLMDKFSGNSAKNDLSQKEKNIYLFIESHPGTRSSHIAKGLDIPLPTVKKILSDMVKNRIITKDGLGNGTNYRAESLLTESHDLVFRLTNTDRSKEFALTAPGTSIEIKEIHLKPLFDFTLPDEWSAILFREEPVLKMQASVASGGSMTQSYRLASYVSPHHRWPVFKLGKPVHIPGLLPGPRIWADYPIKLSFSFEGALDKMSFDLVVIYDEVI